MTDLDKKINQILKAYKIIIGALLLLLPFLSVVWFGWKFGVFTILLIIYIQVMIGYAILKAGNDKIDTEKEVLDEWIESQSKKMSDKIRKDEDHE